MNQFRSKTPKKEKPSIDYLAGFSDAEKHFQDVIIYASCYIDVLEKKLNTVEGILDDLKQQRDNGQNKSD